MKKICMLFFLVLLSLVANAESVEIDGIYYNLIYNSKVQMAEVTYGPRTLDYYGYVSQGTYTGDIVIPESVSYEGIEYSVTSIFGGEELFISTGLYNYVGAFSGCKDLTSITIPSSITAIGLGAFQGCNNLTKVNISNLEAWSKIQFTSSDTNPLYYAKHLYMNGKEIKDLVFPNSLTSIGEYAFSGCSGLTSITIPESVTSIGNNAFRECTGLTSVSISNSVTSIGQSAFSGCNGLTSVTIPESVTDISYGAFHGCSGLKKVIVPKISAWCSISFANALANPLFYAQHLFSDEETEITDMVIPDGVTDISHNAFYGCSGLTSITISNGVTSIGNSTFYGCSGLTSVTIPNSVTSIGESAFSFCRGLTSVTIPNCVTSIGNRAFSDCSGLTSINIPNSVTSIGGSAFSGCSGLTSVTIGNSVTSIGSSAFSGCSGLKYVSLQCQVIGKWFCGLTGIETIEIGNATKGILGSAFSDCKSLKTLTIGKNVSSIGLSAFSNCIQLKIVYSLIESPIGIDNSVFENSLSNNTTLYVPKGKKLSYQNTPAWDLFPIILEIGGNGEQKCSTPTISYANGKLKFNCETEDVSYIYEITDSDIKIGYDTEVDLTITYNITVYATKDGYQDSEAATATLCWVDVEPQTEGIIDEDAIAEVKAMPVLIQSQGSTITIQGAAEGTPIAVYDIEGKQYSSSIAEKDRTTITTSLRPGSVAVVKIGEKSVKVKL